MTHPSLLDRCLDELAPEFCIVRRTTSFVNQAPTLSLTVIADKLTKVEALTRLHSNLFFFQALEEYCSDHYVAHHDNIHVEIR